MDCPFIALSILEGITPNLNCGVWKRNFRLPRYYVIKIFKLEYPCYLLSDWYQTCFDQSRMTMTFISSKVFFYITSSRADMTSLKFQIRISLLFYFGFLSHNLFRLARVVHVTLRSYKISCDLEGYLDILGQLQGKYNFFFLYRLICPFITPPILYRVTWLTTNFQLSSLKMGTSGFGGITSSIYLNWNISIIYCQNEIKLVLVKAEWQWLLFLKTNFMPLPVSQTWRHLSLNCGHLS